MKATLRHLVNLSTLDYVVCDLSHKRRRKKKQLERGLSLQASGRT